MGVIQVKKIDGEDGYIWGEATVDKGIEPYVVYAQSLMGLYTIGCCGGHAYNEEHVLYDESKKTIGWVQLSKMLTSSSSMDIILAYMRNIDRLSIEASCNSEIAPIVCICDPFQEECPMEYNRVWMSEGMWEQFHEHKDRYTLIGIDGVIILNPHTGVVVGKYFPIALKHKANSRLELRKSEIWNNLDKGVPYESKNI